MPLVKKSEYAELKDRAPSAVSNWIRNNQLRAPALVMVDGEELVDVELADAMLAASLDRSQQFAQDRPIAGSAADAEGDEDGDDFRARDDEDRQISKQYLKAKAEAKLLEVEELRRKHALANGRYMEVEEAEAEWGRQIAGVITDINGWIGNVARDVAAELQIDERALGVALQRSYREFRERQAKANAAQLAAAGQ